MDGDIVDNLNSGSGLPSSTASPLKVLIVDDNADLGLVLVEFLEQVGHHPTAVGTAEKALKSLESGSFDVLLTDVRLPGISGIALAKEAVSRWPRMGVLISSGYGDALSLDYFPAELKDVVAIVPKPCDLATLPQALADAASRARARDTRSTE
jgi:DNA-binding NtrC family response regulator